MQTSRRSEGDGDGREKRIGTLEKLRKLQMAFYRKAKAEPKWWLVHAKQNLPLTLVRQSRCQFCCQSRCQFWFLAHPNRRLAVYFRTLYFVDPCLVCSGKKSSFESSMTGVNRLLASMGGLGLFDRLGEFFARALLLTSPQFLIYYEPFPHPPFCNVRLVGHWPCRRNSFRNSRWRSGALSW